MDQNNRKLDLERLKKMAQESGNLELEKDLKKRIKQGNTVNKWQK